MRCSHFLAIAVMLLIATTAFSQNLSIQVTLQTNPTEIPPEGGSFSYQVSVTNHELTPQQCTLWCIATTPQGEQRLALQPITAGIAAGDTVQRSYTLTLPAFATTGNYTLTANIGIYPNSIWDSAQFTFYKLKPPEWVARYSGGPGSYYDEAYSLAVDGNGNVYITGRSYGSGTDYDYVTIKYNSAGFQEWVAHYNGPGNSYDEAASLAVDGSGNVYVTGCSWGSGTDYDYATIKYNSAGVQQWVARYSGPGSYYDEAYNLAVDGSGNVYVTGSSEGSGTGPDYATIKYNSSGVQEWVARYNGPGNDYDEAYSLAVDGSGNVCVTGYSLGSGTDQDYATIKYNSAGVQQWVARYNGPGNHYDYAYSLAVDGSGNVYVTGSSIGSGTNRDYATIRYNSAGVQEWVARYNGPGNNWDEATSLAVDGSSNVYVTGKSFGSAPNYDYATIKYSATDLPDWQQPVATAFGAPLPTEYRLSQNYPNPFNPTTTIRYELPTRSQVKLEVFDVSGRLVSTLINGWRKAGSHEVTFDASGLAAGVYVYRLQVGEYTGVEKMVLLK